MLVPFHLSIVRGNDRDGCLRNPRGQIRASDSGVVLEQSRNGLVYYAWQDWSGTIGTWNAVDTGLGGWSLDVHHSYDPIGRVLYLGDGSRRSASDLRVIDAFAGTDKDTDAASI